VNRRGHRFDSGRRLSTKASAIGRHLYTSAAHSGDLEGWSAMQFVETSSLTIHADESSDRCYVDVFSCKAFDPELAAAIAVEHFGGRPKLTVLPR
jgi:S-adenosylmethionine/arginine decarboxylase-like enzyme